MTDRDLEDRNILIVEDDLLVALDLEQTLNDAGCVAALLDVSLGDEMAFPIADRLSAEGIPFIFITAKPRSVPEHHETRPVIAKPYPLRRCWRHWPR